MVQQYPFPYSKAAELDSRITLPRPAIDPALAPMLDFFQLPEELDIDFMRSMTGQDPAEVKIAAVLQQAPEIKHAEHHVTGVDGNDVVLSVFTPKKPTSAELPALYHVHGGGLISGDRFTAVGELLTDIIGSGIECIVVTVEYRLAPETRAPGGAEDCYAGLVWTAEHAAALGIDPARIVVWGVSGGAALAAAACLMARDRRGPAVRGQMLLSPMLDDRGIGLSDRQFEHGSPWSGVINQAAWAHVLGDCQNVTAYHAPGRAEDLSQLPDTYIDVGACDVFRDQAVQYAAGLWKGGSACELHVWPGAFHLFDALDNADLPLVHTAVEAKRAWLRRMMKKQDAQ